MGEVYRATDLRLKREVAIKVLPPAVAKDPGRLTRFRREARALAALSHPNVATIHAFERAGEVSFIALELVPGPTLEDRVAEAALSVEEVVPLFLRIAKGLEAAHRQGIIHRDLKPANLKLTSDSEVKVKILDFGLATMGGAASTPVSDSPVADRSAVRSGETDAGTGGALSQVPTLPVEDSVSQGGRVAGTPGYMSPEQVRGERVETPTDFWGFGCCLYEAVTGIRLFSPAQARKMRVTRRFERPDLDALEAFPIPLQELVRDCLAEVPMDRPSRWIEVRERLEDILEAEHFQLSNELLCYANPDGTFGRVNQAFERALGWKTSELRGQQFVSFIHPDDVEKTMNEFLRLQEGKETEGFVNRYKCRGGDYLSLRWRARMKTTTKQIVAVANIVSDT